MQTIRVSQHPDGLAQIASGPVRKIYLRISEKGWGVMAGEFKKSLGKFKVPAEQKELFDIVGTSKADIVTRP